MNGFSARYHGSSSVSDVAAPCDQFCPEAPRREGRAREKTPAAGPRTRHLSVIFLLVGIASCALRGGTPSRAELAKIHTIVVLYAENRSFDHLYGMFPGANGVGNALERPELYEQRDHDGSIMPALPPVWPTSTDLTAKVEPDGRFPKQLPNQPFRIDGPGINLGLGVPTRDVVHRFYQSKGQIDGGKNDQFAALSDAGGLVMGYYDGSILPVWEIAQQYTLADNFFMGAFGGSFLNHFWLVCACTPEYQSAPATIRATLDAEGKLVPKSTSPSSALRGPVQLADGAVTPDGYAVNTLQPPFQPSGVAPAAGGDLAYADAQNVNVLPAQHAETIGDKLTQRGIAWAWYAGAWNAAVTDGRREPALPRTVIYARANGAPNFQAHHMPFNYFARFDPQSRPDERAAHLKDGSDFERDIGNGTLPPVAFYKPQGTLNEHPGYTDVLSGDQHIADIIGKLRASTQWNNMLIIVAYDENGGFWDHVPPPRGDAWGPGTRIPAIVVSPFAKRGYVDHTAYDTTSILKLITERFGLQALPGIRPGAGDLTNALAL